MLVVLGCMYSAVLTKVGWCASTGIIAAIQAYIGTHYKINQLFHVNTSPGVNKVLH